MNENNDFATPALDAAIALHEIFITLLQAGFTEKQALFIVVELLNNAGK